MPIPFGHCGQLTSAPSTGPRSTGVGRSGIVIVGLGGTVGVTAVDGGGDAGAPGLVVVAVEVGETAGVTADEVVAGAAGVRPPPPPAGRARGPRRTTATPPTLA